MPSIDTQFKKGHTVTEETRKKMIKARLDKPRCGNPLNWKHSEKTKDKLRLANIGTKKPWMSKKGELSYRWIKDRTKLRIDEIKKYDTRYKYWMLEIKKRDNWKCKINNSDCKGRLEAHHILSWRDHPELRYDINNGITLCLAHHPRSRKGEAELSPFFQKLVAEMN